LTAKKLKRETNKSKSESIADERTAIDQLKSPTESFITTNKNAVRDETMVAIL
jgi:hypothetical protein